MQRTVYLRPLGAFHAPADAAASEGDDLTWRGLPIAGGPLHFAAVEIATRENGKVRRVASALGDFFESGITRDTAAAADLIENITAPRPRLAGLDLTRPRLMGIVNVTPDSFSDGGELASVQAAIDHGLRLVEEGADILDIGGESTRPGADFVPVEEELRRVIPVVEGLRARTEARISVDSRKARVMHEAAKAGADILNDVSALSFDPDALEAAAETGLPVMLMHARGDPKTMNDSPKYSDVVLDVFDYLERRIDACVAAGIPKAKIVADPGIGFGKHMHHGIALLNALSIYHGLGVPVLLGASRKKLIGQLCNVEDAKARVPGSLAAALVGLAQGVQIVRVHDVAATRQAMMVWQASVLGSEKAVLA